mmetsp:Transcript_24836/g.43716  ORF Transcript_24836/g.43716 Transcript_24836/m.43716 type:complete len:126 (+) Transcript_24836:574-951(+)
MQKKDEEIQRQRSEIESLREELSQTHFLLSNPQQTEKFQNRLKDYFVENQAPKLTKKAKSESSNVKLNRRKMPIQRTAQREPRSRPQRLQSSDVYEVKTVLKPPSPYFYRTLSLSRSSSPANYVR